MRPDTSFDGIAAACEAEIYGSSKGRIRLNVLWTDLTTEIPGIARGGLVILDAGGGAGHMALRLAEAGNRVVLCDPSQEMLALAEAAITKAGVGHLVSVAHTPIQELRGNVDIQFDLVLCHAVLEWLAYPKAALAHLRDVLKPGGCLSLLFYNRNAALQRRIFRGEYREAVHELHEGCGRRGNGCMPLADETIREWINDLGFIVRSKAGIRIFHDYLPDAARSGERLNSLLEVERAFRKQEPFASLGHHLHLICEKRQS